LYEKTLT